MARRHGGLVNYLALHAHLYQPPRENPWTDAIERQRTAAPYHDWNERIADECYETLGAVPVRRSGRIARLVNLFEFFSFNLGPTLASWLAAERPDVMEDAAEADRAAVAATGHGQALMQAYGHAILPLCNERERRLQLTWGRADFRARFGRDPRGVWLPECAVDTGTLEDCASLGLSFTILAPEQIAAVRPVDGGEWRDVGGGHTPTDRPLALALPSGRRFLVFPFHGSLSRGVAFHGLLDGKQKLLGAARDALRSVSQEGGMALVAADGETYGHHQQGGEETIAALVDELSHDSDVLLASLEKLAADLSPTHEARLVEPSSWSCAHGVARWAGGCACAASPHDESWSFEWRTHLRAAVTALRDRCFELVDERGGEILREPWDAAEAYGSVLARESGQDDSPLDAWLASHAVDPAGEVARRRAAGLAELVRHTLSAATSCGWFFDDLGRIEGLQVLGHAARAAELARDLFEEDPEPDLLAVLERARSNAPRSGSGAQLYRQRVLPVRRTLGDAIAIHAAGRLVDAAGDGEGSSPAFSRVGTVRIDDVGPVRISGRPPARVTVEGRARAGHRRTLREQESRYRATLARVDRPITILVDGRKPRIIPPPVHEALLRAGTTLLSSAADTPPGLDWVARTARALRVPSSLGDAARASAALRLERALHDPSDGVEPAASALARALRRARACALTREELAACRGRVGRRLAALAARAIDEDDEPAVSALVRACRAARSLLGDAALFSLRRMLVRRTRDHHRASVALLAEASGLAPGALVPSDMPARPPGGGGTAAV